MLLFLAFGTDDIFVSVLTVLNIHQVYLLPMHVPILGSIYYSKYLVYWIYCNNYITQ